MTNSSEPPPSDEADLPPDDQNQKPFPGEGRLMGVDFGTKRLGIAVSTPDQTMASPLENYDRRNPNLDAKHLKELAQDYRIKGLVVGLPVHMSGDEGGIARNAREFGLWLANETGLPIRFWDERFTSAMAEEILQAADPHQKTTQSPQRQTRRVFAVAIFLRRQRPRPKTASDGLKSLRGLIFEGQRNDKRL